MYNDINIKDRITKETSEWEGYITYIYFLDITEEVRQIMGDIIQEAKIELRHLDGADDSMKEEDVIAEAEFVLEEIKKHTTYIDFNGNLYITFTNGRSVCFWHNGWGGLVRYDEN